MLTYTKAMLSNRMDCGDGDGLSFPVASFCLYLQPPVNNWPANGISLRRLLLLQTLTRNERSNDWCGTAGCSFSTASLNVQQRSK